MYFDTASYRPCMFVPFELIYYDKHYFYSKDANISNAYFIDALWIHFKMLYLHLEIPVW